MYVRKLDAISVFSKPKTIQWKPFTKLKYPPIKIDSVTWKIFVQEEITLTPGQVIRVGLGLGFWSTKGVILTSLDYGLRYKNCSLLNEISFGDVPNILVAITNNNSKETVKIKENELLCYVHYRV